MSDFAVRVYKFGLVGAFPEAAVEELRRCHRLSNDLVALELAHEQKVADIWSRYPEVHASEEAVAAAEASLAEMLELAASARQAAGKRAVPPELRARIKEERALLAARRADRTASKGAAFASAKTEFRAALDELRAAIRGTYGPAVDRGLYWANYNECLDRHKAGQKAVAQRRKKGMHASLRFRRWTGEGTLAVQLQRLSTGPVRSPALIGDAERGKYRNVMSITPVLDPATWSTLTRAEQRKHARGEFRFRIGSGAAKEIVAMPVIVHRPIPPDADIVMVRITRRMVADRPKVTIAVTCRVPITPSRTGVRRAALHLGWRSLPDGSLRVGTVLGAGPVPDDLADVVRDHGDWAEVIVPASWREVFTNTDNVRSQRDQNLVALRESLVQTADDPGSTLGVSAAEIAKWKSPARFHELARAAGHGKGAEELESWRRRDRHLWSWEANERDQILGRRNDAWARVARWITTAADMVRVDDWNIADLAALPPMEDDDGHQGRAARANRKLAAPGFLRDQVEQTCRREGVTVERPAVTASAHHACGAPLDTTGRADQIMVWCPACEVMVDQDYNAALWLRSSPTAD